MKDADAKLVEACRGGNKRAFETLVIRYERPVFNAAYRILNNREDANDISQTVFLKVYERLDSYKPEYKFYSWIYRIAINESLTMLNNRKPGSPIDEQQVSEDPSPEQLADSDQLGRKLQGALMQITADNRAVVVLKHFLGCSYRDISEILGIPEKTVKSRLFTARQQLRTTLLRDGMDCL